MSGKSKKIEIIVEPKFFTDKLDRHSIKHYFFFFIMPCFLLILGLLQIILDGIYYSQTEDISGLWDYIAFCFGFWGATIDVVLAIGVAILVISALIPIKIRNNKTIGKIRKFLGVGFVFIIIYLILSLILLIPMAPLNIFYLYTAKNYLLFSTKPLLVIPVVLNYLLYSIHILLAPPYYKVSDLIKSGHEITNLLDDNSLESILNEEDSANKNTIYSIRNKVGNFFVLLDKYLTSRVTFGIYDTAELTAEVVMSWTSSQKTEFEYILTRMRGITHNIENQNIVELKKDLEELIIRAHTSVEKYAEILDSKLVAKDIPKQSSSRKWIIVLTTITAFLLQIIYFIFFLIDRI